MAGKIADFIDKNDSVNEIEGRARPGGLFYAGTNIKPKTQRSSRWKS
jgi:hypothetical protein